jgi:hypothetical protein
VSVPVCLRTACTPSRPLNAMSHWMLDRDSSIFNILLLDIVSEERKLEEV